MRLKVNEIELSALSAIITFYGHNNKTVTLTNEATPFH